MAVRKRNTGILIYNLLLKEISSANKDLPAARQLSMKERRTLISEKLYPKYQDTPFSKIRLGPLRTTVQWHVSRSKKEKVKKPAQKKKAAPFTYNLILQEITIVSKELPENRQFSMKERYALISGKLYPRFKGQKVTKASLEKLRSLIHWHVSRNRSEDECDVLTIPNENLRKIDYFSIDEHIRRLARCIFIKVNAGEFGVTEIFNTRDYEYSSSGVAAITNEINEWLADKLKKQKEYPYYDGIIQLRDKKPNDGSSENYYVEFFLRSSVTDLTYESVTVPGKRRKPSKLKKKQEKQREQIRQRTKELKAEKTYIKGLKRRFRENIKESDVVYKGLKKRKIKFDVKKDQRKTFKSEKKKADKYLEDGKISKAEHKSILNILKRGYEQ